jgi:hypothetical protein
VFVRERRHDCADGAGALCGERTGRGMRHPAEMFDGWSHAPDVPWQLTIQPPQQIVTRACFPERVT